MRASTAWWTARSTSSGQLEKSEPDLRSATHKSLISCEVADWAGGKLSSDPIFIVDIRSRQGTDGGAEYCSEIAKAVKELLDDGFSGVAVSQIQGEVKFEKALVAYRCRLEVFGHIKISYSLSLYPSLASPQPAGTEIVFTAVASPAEGLEYRFLLQGPGTGNAVEGSHRLDGEEQPLLDGIGAGCGQLDN